MAEFPTTPELDTFPDDGGPPPNANWTTMTDMDGFYVDGGQARTDGGGGSYGAVWNTPTGADCEARCKIPARQADTDGNFVLFARADSGGNAGYGVKIQRDDVGGDIVMLDSFVSGLIGGPYPVVYEDGDGIALRCSADTIEAWYYKVATDWTMLGSVTDNDTSGGGLIGFAASGNNAEELRIGNFGGGDYTPPAPQKPSISPPPVVQLSTVFRIRHELDLSEWTTLTGTGISRVTPGLASTLGALRLDLDDDSNRTCEKAFTLPGVEMRYRFHIDTSGLSMSEGDSFVIHRIALDGAIPTLFQIALGYDSGDLVLTTSLWSDDGSHVDGDPITITAAEHYIEVYMQQPEDGSGYGIAVVYVDNVECDVFMANFFALWANITTFCLGAEDLDAGTSGSLYFDEVLMTDRETPIGPYTFSRANLKAFDYRVTLFVGPPRQFVDTPNIAFGVGYDVSAATTLDQDLLEDDDHAHLTDASAFPASGGAYILASQDDEVDEFITYESKASNDLEDVGRYLLSAIGDHRAGAVVQPWIEATQYVAELSLDWHRQGNTVTWEASLRGQNYNSSLFRRDNTIMAKVSFYPADESGGWTTPVVLFFGSITDKNTDDDMRRGGAFTLKVEGPQAYLRAKTIDTHKFGMTDLADSRPVTASSTLKDPLQEAAAGEFVGAPSVAAENVVDGDRSTLWISAQPPDVTVETSRQISGHGYLITEVYPRHIEGYLDGDYQWFELLFGYRQNGLQIAREIRKLYSWKMGLAGHHMHFNDDDGGISSFSSLIFCANRKKFEEAFCVGKYARLFEVGEQLFNTAGDFLALTRATGYDGKIREGAVATAVLFGNSTYPASQLPEPDSPAWSGPAVALPARTHSIYYDFTHSGGNMASYWVEHEYPLPGLHDHVTLEWVSISLPVMTAVLTATLLIDQTTYIELDNLDGLTESGRCQLDLEQIDYTSLDRDNNRVVGLTRGANSTTPAQHNVGVAIMQVEGGVATECLQIGSVVWRRRPVYDGAILVVPSDFSIWLSNEESPDYPAEGVLPGSEWKRVSIVASWADAEYIGRFSPIRARHALILIRKMSNAGRAKLNEVEVYEATATIDAIKTAEYADVGAIVAHILINHVGLTADEIDIQETVPFLEKTTGKATALALLDDLAKQANCLLVCELDGKITWQHDPLYPMSTLPPISMEIGRSSGIKASFNWSHGIDTSQVVVKARRGDLIFQGAYPPVADQYGDVQTIEDTLLGSAAEAQRMAEMIYRRIRGGLSGTLEMAGTGENSLDDTPLMRPSSRITVTWDLSEDLSEFSQHNFVVDGVHLSANFGSPGGDAKTWGVTFQVSELKF